MNNPSDLKSKAESVLFSAGRALSFEELMRLCRETHGQQMLDALDELRRDLDAKASGIMLVEDNGTFKMTVREKYVPVVRQVVKKAELTKGLLETLAFVAYKAPVLQRDVTRVRTNKAYDHLAQLESGGYITREKKGRTKLIKLTQKFYAYFDAAPGRLHERLNAAAPKLGDLEIYPTTPLVNSQVIPQPQGEQLGKLEVYDTRIESKSHLDVEIDKTEKNDTQANEGSSAESVKINTNIVSSENASMSSDDNISRDLAAVSNANLAVGDDAQKSELSKKQELSEITEERTNVSADDKVLPVQSQSPADSETPKGLFADGIPPSVQEKIDTRVNEILKGEKKESDNPFEEQ